MRLLLRCRPHIKDETPVVIRVTPHPAPPPRNAARNISVTP